MNTAFAENAFAMQSTDPRDKRPPGHGLFLLLSRFNHSCVPNAKVPVDEDRAYAIFAMRDIVPGEEITSCYNSDFEGRTRWDRHRLLRFECHCKACLIGTPFHALSDIRRTLIRGLSYLTCGRDMDGRKHAFASPIIFDPGLRRDAETFSISLSARLIYNLLIMFFLEEEGLLDGFMFKRMYPGILKVSTWFKTESNARIAMFALSQDTWLKKLCVALTLYGKSDIADHQIAEGLRVLHLLR